MAVVYLAHHVTLQRHVALKVLRPLLAKSDRAIGRFAREAKAASLLDHDNIVSVLDFGLAAEGFYYLAMEYVAGTPLDNAIERSAPLGAARAVHIAAQIAAGAAHGHERGIVHRDLKPENVMLTSRGSDEDFVKIVDFGLAKPTMGAALGPAITQPGDLFGTPFYMAPELWRSAEVDARADIYALGIVVYEMLCGEGPFRGDSPVELMNQHLNAEPAPPSSRARGAGVLPPLDEIVLRCLRKDPEARFESMRALGAALETVWQILAAGASGDGRTHGGAASATYRGATLGATRYEPASVDAVWDGPILAEEITHLQALRQRRLAEVADALWPSTLPDRVGALRTEIAALEERALGTGQRIAVLRADLEEVVSTARAQEAELRAGVVDANIARAAQRNTSLAELAPEELQTTVQHYDPLVRLRGAERRLATFGARSLEERLRREVSLGDIFGELTYIERELGKRYEELGALVQDAGAGRPELRRLLVAFGEVEGALASYEALLAMWQSGH
jgi:hypothetical protein